MSVRGIDAEKEEFCQLVASGKKPLDAYLQVKPETTSVTAKRMSRRWMTYDFMKDRITELAGGTINDPKSKRRIVALATARAADEVVELIREVKADRLYVMNNLVEIVERCMQRAPVMNPDGTQMATTNANGEIAQAWEFDSKGAIAALKLIGLENQMFVKQVNLRTSLLDGLPAEVLKFMQERLVNAVESSQGRTIEHDRSLVDRPTPEG